MKKQVIIVTVTNDNVSYAFIPEQERTKGKKLVRVQLGTHDREQDTSAYTDYMSAYVERDAPRFVLRALKTVYARSWNKKIEQLYNECMKLWASRTGYTLKEANEIFERELMDDITAYLPESADVATEKAYAVEGTAHVMKLHTYTMRKDDKGKPHKVECIPFETYEQTQYGKVLAREHMDTPTLDVNDLVQVASLAMVELVSCGLVNSPSDMYDYRTYMYKAVNRYIMGERAKAVNEKPYVYTVDEGGTEHIMTERAFVDTRLSHIEKDGVIEQLSALLVSLLDKRTNKENVLFTFLFVVVGGHSQTECAKRLKVDEKQVRRYVEQVKKALNTPSVYNVLNECVNG